MWWRTTQKLEILSTRHWGFANACMCQPGRCLPFGDAVLSEGQKAGSVLGWDGCARANQWSNNVRLHEMTMVADTRLDWEKFLLGASGAMASLAERGGKTCVHVMKPRMIDSDLDAVLPWLLIHRNVDAVKPRWLACRVLCGVTFMLTSLILWSHIDRFRLMASTVEFQATPEVTFRSIAM